MLLLLLLLLSLAQVDGGKNQESEEKNKADYKSIVDQTSDKLLPWEDILPPKTRSYEISSV